MAQQKEKKGIQSIAGLIFKSIWLAVALFFFAIGITMFVLYKDTMGFGAWLVCGFACLIPRLGVVIKETFSDAKKGARRGANDYTATVDSTGVTVKNHVFSGMITSIIAAIFVSLLFGVIVLGIEIIEAAIDVIRFSIKLAKLSAFLVIYSKFSPSIHSYLCISCDLN